MRTTAFWTLYVGFTILIGSVCHYHTTVEGRPGKSPAGKTVVTKNRKGGKGGGRGRQRKTMAGRMLEMDAEGNPVSNDDDYVAPCVGVCQYHREQKYKRDHGITDPPTPATTTINPKDRTTKDYGRHAKEIGRGSAVPGAWQGRRSGIYFAIISSILTATISSCLVSSDQLYYSGGGKWVQSLKPL